MIYKTILPLLIGLLSITEINGQTPDRTRGNDTIINEEYGGYGYEEEGYGTDSVEVKEDCKKIKTEQREINNEVKRQLDVLREFLNRGEGEDPEKKL